MSAEPNPPRRTFLGHIAGATAMAGILYGCTDRPAHGLLAMCAELRSLDAVDFISGHWPSEAARIAAIDANDVRYQALMLKAAATPARNLDEVWARAAVLNQDVFADLHRVAGAGDRAEVAMWKALAADLMGRGGSPRVLEDA